MIFTFPPSTTWFLVFLDCSAVRGVQRKNILNTAKQDRKRPKNFYKAFFDVKKRKALGSHLFQEIVEPYELNCPLAIYKIYDFWRGN